ncbi:MAG: substrate-binding domain-containing protein [Propionibacteriaceae bacterium]|jgi:ribose transport system substrate-binding protein|nr:substrate-binding domain-containing protein [Propionibacteriaceae bacterium]
MPKLPAAVAAIVAVALLAVTGCSGPQTYIMVIGRSTQGKYWEAAVNGATEQAAAEGVAMDFFAPARADDVDGQLQLVQQALDTHPSAIAYSPINPTAGIELLKQIREAGIPLIVFETKTEGFIGDAVVVTNNQNAAWEAARHICDLTGGKGSVLIAANGFNHQTNIDRHIGFQRGINENCPDMEWLDPINTEGDVETAIALTKEALKAHEDLAGILIVDQVSAEGIIETVTGMKNAPVLVGFDSGKVQTTAIREGVMAGAIAQDPAAMGEKLISTAVKFVQGKGDEIASQVDVSYVWYDKSTIDKPNIQALITES